MLSYILTAHLHRERITDGLDLKCACGGSPQKMASYLSCGAYKILDLLLVYCTPASQTEVLAEFWSKHI